MCTKISGGGTDYPVGYGFGDKVCRPSRLFVANFLLNFIFLVNNTNEF